MASPMDESMEDFVKGPSSQEFGLGYAGTASQEFYAETLLQRDLFESFEQVVSEEQQDQIKLDEVVALKNNNDTCGPADELYQASDSVSEARWSQARRSSAGKRSISSSSMALLEAKGPRHGLHRPSLTTSPVSTGTVESLFQAGQSTVKPPNIALSCVVSLESQEASLSHRLSVLLKSLKDLLSTRCACTGLMRKKKSPGPDANQNIGKGLSVRIDLTEAGKERPLVEDCVKGLGWETSVSFFKRGHIRWVGNALHDGEHEVHAASCQMVLNRFPGLHELTKKQCFAKILSAMQEIQPEEYSFFPPTWVLPEDRKVLDIVLSTQPRKPPTTGPYPPAPVILPEPSNGIANRLYIQAREIAEEELNKPQQWPTYYQVASGMLDPDYIPTMCGVHRSVKRVKEVREELKTPKEIQQESDARRLDSELPTTLRELEELRLETEGQRCVEGHLFNREEAEERGLQRNAEVLSGGSQGTQECSSREDYSTRQNPEPRQHTNTCTGKRPAPGPEIGGRKCRTTIQSCPSHKPGVYETSSKEETPPHLNPIPQRPLRWISPLPCRREIATSVIPSRINEPGYLESFAERAVTTTRPSPLLAMTPVTRWPLPKKRTSKQIKRQPTDPFDEKKEVFIMKPDCGAQGMDIRLFCSGHTLPEGVLDGKDGYIVQQYITHPFLLGGKKFDFRVYALILNVTSDPQVFISRRGLARFCTEEYEAPHERNLHNHFMHLTNYAVNKEHRLFKRSNNVHSRDNSKRLLEDVLEELLAHGVDVEDVWRQMVTIVERTMAALLPFLSVRYRGVYGTEKNRCFQIIGFDILLDRDHKAWLLEVNANPSLRSDYGGIETCSGVVGTRESLLDRQVKEPLVREALLLIYFLTVGPLVGLNDVAECTCRRTLVSSMHQQGEHFRKKTQRRLRLRRVSCSPTQIYRLLGKEGPERPVYVPFHWRRLPPLADSPMAAGRHGGRATGGRYPNEKMCRRSFSQGEDGLLSSSSILMPGRKGQPQPPPPPRKRRVAARHSPPVAHGTPAASPSSSSGSASASTLQAPVPETAPGLAPLSASPSSRSGSSSSSSFLQPSPVAETAPSVSLVPASPGSSSSSSSSCAFLDRDPAAETAPGLSLLSASPSSGRGSSSSSFLQPSPVAQTTPSLSLVPASPGSSSSNSSSSSFLQAPVVAETASGLSLVSASASSGRGSSSSSSFLQAPVVAETASSLSLVSASASGSSSSNSSSSSSSFLQAPIVAETASSLSLVSASASGSSSNSGSSSSFLQPPAKRPSILSLVYAAASSNRSSLMSILQPTPVAKRASTLSVVSASAGRSSSSSSSSFLQPAPVAKRASTLSVVSASAGRSSSSSSSSFLQPASVAKRASTLSVVSASAGRSSSSSSSSFLQPAPVAKRASTVSVVSASAGRSSSSSSSSFLQPASVAKRASTLSVVSASAGRSSSSSSSSFLQPAPVAKRASTLSVVSASAGRSSSSSSSSFLQPAPVAKRASTLSVVSASAGRSSSSSSSSFLQPASVAKRASTLSVVSASAGRSSSSSSSSFLQPASVAKRGSSPSVVSASPTGSSSSSRALLQPPLATETESELSSESVYNPIATRTRSRLAAKAAASLTATRPLQTLSTRAGSAAASPCETSRKNKTNPPFKGEGEGKHAPDSTLPESSRVARRTAGHRRRNSGTCTVMDKNTASHEVLKREGNAERYRRKGEKAETQRTREAGAERHRTNQKREERHQRREERAERHQEREESTERCRKKGAERRRRDQSTRNNTKEDECCDKLVSIGRKPLVPMLPPCSDTKSPQPTIVTPENVEYCVRSVLARGYTGRGKTPGNTTPTAPIGKCRSIAVTPATGRSLLSSAYHPLLAYSADPGRFNKATVRKEPLPLTLGPLGRFNKATVHKEPPPTVGQLAVVTKTPPPSVSSAAKGTVTVVDNTSHTLPKNVIPLSELKGPIPSFQDSVEGNNGDSGVVDVSNTEAGKKSKENGEQTAEHDLHNNQDEPDGTVELKRTAPRHETKNLAESLVAAIAGSSHTAACVFTRSLVSQCCVWDPLCLSPPLRESVFDPYKRCLRRLIKLTGPSLLERCQKLFERITRFPEKRLVYLDDWLRLCRLSRLAEIMRRLWVSVPARERKTFAPADNGEKRGTNQTTRTCTRFLQRPMRTPELVAAYKQHLKEELRAQVDAPSPETHGLTFWGFWELFIHMSAVTDLLIMRHQDYLNSKLHLYHYFDARCANLWAGSNPTMQLYTASERQSTWGPGGRANGLRGPFFPRQIKNSANQWDNRGCANDQVKSGNMPEGDEASSSDEEFDTYWDPEQGRLTATVTPLMFLHQDRDKITRAYGSSRQDVKFNSFLVQETAVPPPDVNTDMVVRPLEYIYVPWLPNTREGYFIMTMEQRTIALDCLLAFFGV